MSLLRRFYEGYGRVLGAAAIRNFDEVEQALPGARLPRPRAQGGVAVVSPDKLVRSLLTLARVARRRRRRASSTPTSRSCSCRRGAGWSDGDVPLLDEARALLDAPPRAYGHVIVDEAQDLTPMQLRMVARRARDGSLTILGDVAQATGRGRATARWDERAAAPAARRRGGRRGAAARLPRAARDHGARAAAARHDRARRRAADRLPHGRRRRRVSAGSTRSTCSPRRTARPSRLARRTACSR